LVSINSIKDHPVHPYYYILDYDFADGENSVMLAYDSTIEGGDPQLEFLLTKGLQEDPFDGVAEDSSLIIKRTGSHGPLAAMMIQAKGEGGVDVPTEVSETPISATSPTQNLNLLRPKSTYALYARTQGQQAVLVKGGIETPGVQWRDETIEAIDSSSATLNYKAIDYHYPDDIRMTMRSGDIMYAFPIVILKEKVVATEHICITSVGSRITMIFFESQAVPGRGYRVFLVPGLKDGEGNDMALPTDYFFYKHSFPLTTGPLLFSPTEDAITRDAGEGRYNLIFTNASGDDFETVERSLSFIE
jgi:hypothetical protein